MITILRNILFILIWTGLFILINIAVTLITVTILYYLDYFARIYRLKAEVLLVCAVLQLNKLIVEPFYLLAGLSLAEPYEDYNQSLGRRMTLVAGQDGLSVKHKTSSSYEVSSFSNAGRMNLEVAQVGLSILRCLTSAKMIFTYDLSLSKIIGWYWFNKGLAFERNGEYHLAVEYYEKAYIHNPTKVDIWYNLGYCYRQDKQFDKAIACFKKVRLLDQNQEYDVLYYIGSCLGELKFGVA